MPLASLSFLECMALTTHFGVTGVIAPRSHILAKCTPVFASDHYLYHSSSISVLYVIYIIPGTQGRIPIKETGAHTGVLFSVFKLCVGVFEQK